MSSQPPRLATWLLERLASGPKRESLIGDLVEQHGYGRSAVWYWRQVTAAIISATTGDAREHRVFALTAVAAGQLLLISLGWMAGLAASAAGAWMGGLDYQFPILRQWWIFWPARLIVLCLATGIGGWLIALRYRDQRSLRLPCAADAALWNAAVWACWNAGLSAWGFWTHLNTAGPPFGVLHVVVLILPLIAGMTSVVAGGLLGAGTQSAADEHPGRWDIDIPSIDRVLLR
jgi:hypothetical protein